MARRAMLDALDDEELIVGGYVDQAGRVCPMLAAHRRGARIDVGSFPRAYAEARVPGKTFFWVVVSLLMLVIATELLVTLLVY